MTNVVALRKPLTREDIIGRKTTDVVHMDFDRKRSAWIYGLEDLPRLKVYDEHDGRAKKTTRTWSVDGKAVRDLDAALAVLNGEMSIEEATMVIEAPPAKRPKRSLTSQIADLDLELKRIAENRPLRKSEAELHVENLKAVRATLVWLQDNELHIKQRASY